ncbi:hypothetical protein FQN60_006049 [Etheostoma spectabile]|uniref:C-type lectin domain-containing protein n=1 Tax=Etheostoma spectabile TaxID=54343 RepID=A0A5J5CBC8_9PERO|nr:hypothetical protein FQN60_006049 [Etheostoma spectabile]
MGTKPDCFLASFFTQGQQAPCPPSWTQCGSRCFLFNTGPKNWIDGEFDFQSFGVGEPNNQGGAENCVVMNFNGKNWNDGSCENLAAFMCSKDSV